MAYVGAELNKMFKIPRLAGDVNEKRVDLAFAEVSTDSSCTFQSSHDAIFYLPVAKVNESGLQVHQLVDAREVTFGKRRFYSFTGACRSSYYGLFGAQVCMAWGVLGHPMTVRALRRRGLRRERHTY